MSDKKEPVYKVQTVKIKNFKNIENLEMDLQGRTVFLIGENALNKSSVLQAVWYALSRKGKPKAPIKEGQTEAEIIVVIGKDGHNYEVKCTFKEGEADKLEITSPDGFKTSKVEKLVELVGDVNFNISEFVGWVNTAEGRRKQVKVIRGYLSDDENARLDAINENIKNIEENRTRINTDIKRLKVEVANVQFAEGDIEKYKELIDVGTLMAEQTKALETNGRIETREREIQYQKNEIEQLKKREEEMQKAWETVVAQRMEKEHKLVGIEKELENSIKIDIDPIKKQILECGTHNGMVQKIQAHNKKTQELADNISMYEGMGDARDIKTAEKKEIIKNAKLPVEGITFDEDTLYYKLIPLDETQQSTSELMEIGIKLAMAKAPQCHIVKVDRAESLGTKRLNSILELAKANNYQMFFEEVQRGQEELKIEYVE